MNNHLYKIKKDLTEQGIFFCFSGPISQNLLVEIGDTLKKKMEMEETSRTTVLKVFSMLVEQTQNIIHYSAEKIPNGVSDTSGDPGRQVALSLGIITVGFENGHYFVLCGNIVENEIVSPLSEKLFHIRDMNKTQLKQYYREQRKLEAANQSRGAGLGFVEVARKASRPIEFNFEKIDGRHSFFSLKAVI